MSAKEFESLSQLLETDDGKNVLAGYRRTANILRAEERKDGVGAFSAPHDPAMLALPEEKALAAANVEIQTAVSMVANNQGFNDAIYTISTSRSPVDAFFLNVTVNDADQERRRNRLRLLNELREAMHALADFSKIVG